MIDLRSDTVCKPSPEMLEAISKIDRSKLGDDVFGEDELTNEFEQEVADLLGKEAGLFVPSGTMANQLAIKISSSEGDEVICETGAHIANYETAAPAVLSRVQLKTIDGENGILNVEQIRDSIRPSADWYPHTSLVALENTHNRAGGTIYPKLEIERIAELCRSKGLRLHLDGARLWNACIAAGLKPRDYAQYFDTITVCFSKGLGAPIGSMILARNGDIQKARRYRKMWGGGMRQTGIISSMSKFALDNNFYRLKTDHFHARMLADTLSLNPRFKVDLKHVQTNIVAVDLTPLGKNEKEVVDWFKANGVLVSSIKLNFIRMVTHIEISQEQINTVCNLIKTL